MTEVFERRPFLLIFFTFFFQEVLYIKIAFLHLQSQILRGIEYSSLKVKLPM